MFEVLAGAPPVGLERSWNLPLPPFITGGHVNPVTPSLPVTSCQQPLPQQSAGALGVKPSKPDQNSRLDGGVPLVVPVVVPPVVVPPVVVPPVVVPPVVVPPVVVPPVVVPPVVVPPVVVPPVVVPPVVVPPVVV